MNTKINTAFLAALCSVIFSLNCHSISAADAVPAKLVIVKAVYGDLPDGDSTDVTNKVSEMVKENALSVEATNDNFGDPAEGIVKKLRVDFKFDGVAGTKTVDENETMTITAADKPDPSKKLVIRKAVYGDLPDGDSTDVTKKVAEMVKDNALSVEATNDNFGDPAEGIVKKLKIDYTFAGMDKTKTVDEGETLTISATGD